MNIKIFGELLFEKDQNDPLLDHIIICIYGLLKEHIATLISTNKSQQKIYADIKGLIFECVNKRYLKVVNPSYIMRKNICDCLSILIISGITCSWKSSIEDLIKEANGDNPEMIFIALRAIADCDLIMNFYESKNEKENDDNYWDDNLHFHNEQKLEIKKCLIEKSEIVFNFIDKVYININKFEKNLKNRIIKAIIDLIAFWTQLNLNILKNKNITFILELINMTDDECDKFENLKSFTEVINKNILVSSNFKLYEFYDKVVENGTENEIIQVINNNIDLEEKKGIEQYLNYILQKFEEYIKIKKNENFIWVYGKIFSSILENYIYFFFDFNNQMNEKVFKWLKYFISYKKRKISWMFFSCIESMSCYISDYYRFYDANDLQKKEFSDYLMDLLFNVMNNCALSKLNQNDLSQLNKSILFKDNEFNWNMKDKNELYNNMNYDDLDYDDIDIKEYRNSAESVFYSIYTIFKEGLNKDYELLFINKLTSLINLNDENIRNNFDDNTAIKLDIILLVLKSIAKEIDNENSFEVIKILNNYIYNLSNSSYIENISIFIDYLLLINQFNDLLLVGDNIYFEKTIILLLEVSNSNINQIIIDSCYQVISNLCDEIKGKINFEKIFNYTNIFFERFQKIYNQYEINNISPLENLIRSMFYVIGINENIDNIELNKAFMPYVKNICKIITNDLHLLLEKQKCDDIILKSGIIKSYLLYKEIFCQIYSSNPVLRKEILKDFMENTLDDLITIFKLLPNDIDVFNPIINFYITNASIIAEDCINKFSLINNIFIQLLKSNRNYYQIIEFLGILYKSVLSNLNTNNNNEKYIEENKYILNNFFSLISCSIEYIKAEREFNSLFIEKIKIISYVINDVFPLLYILKEQNAVNEDIINNIVDIFDYLKNIFILLIKEKNNNLTNDNLISIVIKSVSILFNEKILKNLLIFLPNNKCEEIVIQIIVNTWNLLEIKKFNFLSSQELSQLYLQIISFNSGAFNTIFKQCISSTQKYNDTYINNICNYISFYCNNKDKIKNFITDILSTFYDKKEPDSLEFYFNQLKKKRNI